MSKVFISVAGNIGSGKTTLTRLLARRYLWDPYYESVQDNPYLKDFYVDMKRWSMALQIYFLSHRFNAHLKILNSSRSSIQDRSIYEDCYIFARNLHESGLMDDRDYQNYASLFEIMSKLLTPPDLVLYVRKSIPKLCDRIKMRGREYEQNIPTDYLEKLNVLYDEWIAGYKLGNVLTIEADDLDFIHSKNDLDEVCKQIFSSINQPDFFMNPSRAISYSMMDVNPIIM